MMRRSERDARLSQRIARCLEGVQSLLAIDVPAQLIERDGALAGCRVTVLASGEERAAEAGSFEALLVRVSDPETLPALLARLRPRLSGGAPVVLVAAAKLGARQRLAALWTREPPKTVALEPLCEALVRAGLETPRVHAEASDSWLVAATKPRTVDVLDAFFEQPRDTASR